MNDFCVFPKDISLFLAQAHRDIFCPFHFQKDKTEITQTQFPILVFVAKNVSILIMKSCYIR